MYNMEKWSSIESATGNQYINLMRKKELNANWACGYKNKLSNVT